MKNEFVKLTASYGVINIFHKLADYCTTILFISIFTTAQYGVISLNTTIILGLTSLFSLSLEGAITRYYYKYEGSELSYFLGCIVSYLIIFSFFIGVLFLLFSKPLWALILADIPYSPYIIIAIIISMIDPINKTYFAYIQVKRDIKKYAIYYNCYVFIRLILLTCAAFFYQSVELYFIAYVISVLVCVPIVIISFSKHVKWNLNTVYIKEALSYSIYIIPVTFFNIVNSLVGRSFLMNNIDIDSVGVYSAGANIGQVVYLVATVFNMAYVSFFIQQYEKGKDTFDVNVQKMSDIMFFFIFLIAFILSAISPLIKFAFPANYIEAVVLIPICAFTGVANGLYFMSTNYLSLKRPLVKYKFLGLMIGVILNIVISLLLIKSIGIYGIALANFFSVFIASCVLKMIANNIGKFKYSNKQHLLTSILLFVVYGMYFTIDSIHGGLKYIVVLISLSLFYYLFDKYYFFKRNFITINILNIYNHVKAFYFK